MWPGRPFVGVSNMSDAPKRSFMSSDEKGEAEEADAR